MRRNSMTNDRLRRAVPYSTILRALKGFEMGCSTRVTRYICPLDYVLDARAITRIPYTLYLIPYT